MDGRARKNLIPNELLRFLGCRDNKNKFSPSPSEGLQKIKRASLSQTKMKASKTKGRLVNQPPVDQVSSICANISRER